MKTRLRVYFLLFFILSSLNIFSQFSLGDIAFSGYSSDTATPNDSFTIVLLRNVTSGESLGFTENGWLAIGGFRSGEGSFTLTFGSNYSTGTQIVISRDPFQALDQSGSSAGSLTGSGLSLATGGDQIFAYNPANIPSPGNESGFVAAIQMNGPWDPDASSTTTSAKPSVFTDGTNSISINPEVDNARLSLANCSNFSDTATLRTLLNTSSNWETNDSNAYVQSPPICDFTSGFGNNAPTATAPSAPTVLEDAVNIALADNIQISDADGDDQTVTFTITGGTITLGTTGITFGGSGNGSASFTAQGTLANINAALDAATFTPTPNLNGTNAGTISFTTNDGTETSSPASITFDVTAVNDEPSFTAGANEAINEDAGAQTINGWATAIDDGDTDATQTFTFTVTNDNNALFNTQPAISASGNLTYTTATNANGSATVSVVLSDDGGTANGGDDTFATQQFTITVNAVNDEPSFTAGANEAINEDAGAQTVTGWATAIDDGDSDATQTLTFTVTNNNNALFSTQPAINVSGNLTYTTATNANGSATVSVVLSDDGGTANGGDDTFATQQFTITVNAVNDEPSFTAGANEAINEDAGAQTVTGWATAIDDGDSDATQTLTFTVTNDNNALFNTQPAISASGNLTYTTATNANGSATVSVVLSDDGGTANGGDDTFATQQFTITVNAVNDEPSFTAGANEAINEDAGAQTVTGWATAIDDGDSDATQTLTFTVTNDNNALFSTQPAIDVSGNLTYTTAANANGSATVSVVLSDDGGTANGGGDTFATQQFTITVNAVNDEPSFTAGANETINENAGSQTVNGWATAIDDGDADATQTLTFTVTNDNNALFSAQPAISPSGDLTYTPSSNTNGSATVNIVLSDDGGTSNGGDDTFSTQQFTITITNVNNEPSFTAGANEVINEDAGAQTVNGWATAIDDGDSNVVQILSFNISNNNNALFSIQPAIDASGNLTYTPGTNANGTTTVTVSISDDGGTANGGDDTSDNQTFTITVTAVNDEPSFTAGANESVNENAGAQTVNSWATVLDDGDADAAQTLNFNISNDNNALFSSQPAIDASGNLTYTPATNTIGSAMVTVSISDNGGIVNGGDDTSDDQTFTITVLDNTSPTINITSTESFPTGANPIPITITFSEVIDNFDIANIIVGNGTASNLSPLVNNTVYTVNINPASTGVITVDINANVSFDAAGNGNTAASQFSIDFDGTRPGVVVSSSETSPTGANPIPILITFDEDVINFDITDINIGNGVASNFVGSDASYTADITPTTSGPVVVIIDENMASDLVFNGNTVSNTLVIQFDNTLSINDQDLANALTVYPTPSNNIINITGAIGLEIERTEIFDIQGKLILSQKLDSSSIINTIDIASIRSGLYLMTIYSETGSTTKRIVKQ